MTMLILAMAAFVGTHFLLSHPLRAPIVRAVGTAPFLGIYSLVAAATLTWVVMVYRALPPTAPLWPVGDGLWAIGSAIMLVASVLLLGSLIRNPAAPDPAMRDDAPVPEARGVYSVTRHPMMWAMALWGVTHMLVFPVLANLVLASGIIVLALGGAALQDRKKAALFPRFWTGWQAQTSYLPFAAIAAGRARFGGFRPHDLAGGLIVWLAATWVHIPLAGMAAGIWRWIG